MAVVTLNCKQPEDHWNSIRSLNPSKTSSAPVCLFSLRGHNWIPIRVQQNESQLWMQSLNYSKINELPFINVTSLTVVRTFLTLRIGFVKCLSSSLLYQAAVKHSSHWKHSWQQIMFCYKCNHLPTILKLKLIVIQYLLPSSGFSSDHCWKETLQKYRLQLMCSLSDLFNILQALPKQ